ncbi:hypothetical protein [Streptomyces ipomoeae]|uniref:hypothetical protein n=1 Tax=Streptomyces ipomoeae TaxID=103232 RepID=UPI0029AEEA2F|nr:hypothetical protein [Streptomyces ipomoeae]MDX2695932.1 hypothetical protein [Streptomyces ipomoeae]MDX2843386.1 hypothetical protein [Streptomyces ipomoeae]
MRTALLIPVLYVLARAPQVGALLVAAGLASLIGQSGMPLLSGLVVMLIAALGVMAVGLALALPYLPYARSSGPPSS